MPKTVLIVWLFHWSQEPYQTDLSLIVWSNWTCLLLIKIINIRAIVYYRLPRSTSKENSNGKFKKLLLVIVLDVKWQLLVFFISVMNPYQKSSGCTFLGDMLGI